MIGHVARRRSVWAAADFGVQCFLPRDLGFQICCVTQLRRSCMVSLDAFRGTFVSKSRMSRSNSLQCGANILRTGLVLLEPLNVHIEKHEARMAQLERRESVCLLNFGKDGHRLLTLSQQLLVTKCEIKFLCPHCTLTIVHCYLFPRPPSATISVTGQETDSTRKLHADPADQTFALDSCR